MPMPLHVLIVEDSEDDVLLLLRVLRQGGYKPIYRWVDTVDTFVAALTNTSWELVIADYALPQFSGLMALQLLHAHGQDIPFIIVSGAIGEEMAVEAMKAGAHDYVMKNNLVRLLPAVARELREAAGRREQRAAEAARRVSDARYRDIFENANDILYTHDLQGCLTSLNRKGEILTGYRRDEALGQPLSRFLAPEYVVPTEERLARLRDGLVEEIVCELALLGKSGQRLPVEVSARLIYADRQAVGIQGIARDISERQQLEEQLRQAQKMEAVGRLAGGVAHDFNNLLTAILGYSQMVLRRLRPEDPSHREILEIEKAAQRAASLTQQLLVFSRKQVFQPKVVHLNLLVKDVEKMLGRLIGEDIELVTKLEPALWHVKVDSGQLQQVLLNLAINARDAMPHGGTLTLETANRVFDAVHVSWQADIQPGFYVALVVRDTGLGMDHETMRHIFEPFFTTKGPGQGTGLGLSTVYGIVKQSGGHIRVASELGQGATFTIYLPRVLADLDSSTGDTSALGLLHGSETLLVVEDDEAVRLLVCQILQTYGYQVLEAGNARDALTLCTEHTDPVDLLVTDVIMPGMSGRELAERVTALRPSIKVLYMSGYTAEALKPLTLVLEDRPFLQKPFTPEALLYKVREVLQGAAHG